MMHRSSWLAMVALVVTLMAGCSLLGGGGATPQPTGGVPTATAVAELPAGWSGGTIGVEALPPQALETLRRIADGGPYLYDQDGATFQNRERILPDRPRGYYREYTVETPGSPDRGARRIVTGRDGERYYTDDHYDSFRLIVGGLGT
jgi:ribonuclease T1